MAQAVDSDYDVNRTETVPESARVRDFDELDDSAQEFFLHIADGASPRDPSNLSGLDKGDVVVYTDYYHVQ